ncbi:hypothetical protein HKX48_006016 [Thoreauomyces humboldtii]|nr:hypothetical protein HKX48_006016 [Thoreauomyces humboldtii]
MVEWCARRGLLTDWQRAVDILVGSGKLAGAVTILSVWTETAGNIHQHLDDGGSKGLSRASSQATVVPGLLAATTASINRPKSLNPPPVLLQTLLLDDNLPLFIELLPHLPQPLPASVVPRLLASPRILSHMLKSNSVAIDSFLLTLARSPAATRKIALRSLASTPKHSKDELRCRALEACSSGDVHWRGTSRPASGW